MSKGSRVWLTLPDGTRTGFSTGAETKRVGGGTLARPIFTADGGHRWELAALTDRLVLSGGRFFFPFDGRPDDPVAQPAEMFTLTAPDGTLYELTGTGAVRSITRPDGTLVRLTEIADDGRLEAAIRRDARAASARSGRRRGRASSTATTRTGS